MPKGWLELDAVLKDRLRVVLDPGRPVAEWELRKLSEQGRACSLIVGAELKRSEQKLAELDADPASPLVEIATTFRKVNTLRAHLDELHELLGQLQERAQEARAAWL
jgi:hypothetical protein